MKAVAAISVVLEDLFKEFQALVDAQDDPPASPVLIFGPKDNQANIAPPGIYWAPGEESWTAPQAHGRPGFPRSLWTRNIPVNFEVFGGENAFDAETLDDPATNLSDLDASEALAMILANAFQRRLSQHGHQISGMGWGQSQQTGIGQVALLRATLRLPVVAIDNPTRRYSSIVTNAEFNT